MGVGLNTRSRTYIRKLTDDPATEWVKQLYQDEFVKINSTDILSTSENITNQNAMQRN